MTREGATTYPIPTSPGGALTVYRDDLPLLTNRRRLCSVVERLAASDQKSRIAFQGMPWFTPILGSGCLELGDSPSVDLAAIETVTRTALQALHIDVPLRELGDPGSLALAFATALHDGRTQGQSPSTDLPRTDPSAKAARLTLGTALLTRLFHGACMSIPSPTSRWWGKERAELTGSTSTDIHIRETVLPTILELFDAIDRYSIPKDLSNAEIGQLALLRRISKRLRGDPPAVRVEDLRLLTEITWLELVKDTTIYPGWSDLLLTLLMTYSETASNAPAGYRPKVVELEQLGKEVADLLEGPTNLSWASRMACGGSQERDTFYSSIAHLLHAQARLFRLLHPPNLLSIDEEDSEEYRELRDRFDRSVRIKGKIFEDAKKKLSDRPGNLFPKVNVPHPVAFVTSFDLEMEMALWALDQPYRVVIPVLAMSSRRVEADLIWLAATVNPRAGDVVSEPRALREGPHEWRNAQEIFRPGEGGEYPIVVRLSGCPLMDLPTVIGQLQDDFSRLGFTDEERITLFHALTIDEYTSLRQSENELFFAAQGLARGLPRCLCGGTDSNERIWVGFGVQLDDPAIRARMFSQLSTGSMRQRTDRHAQMQAGNDQSESNSIEEIYGDHLAVRGLAVNKRIDEDEATVLHWLGFEFALDINCSSLTADIDHCADHVIRVIDQAEALDPHDTTPGNVARVDASWDRARDESCSIWSPNVAGIPR